MKRMLIALIAVFLITSTCFAEEPGEKTWGNFLFHGAEHEYAPYWEHVETDRLRADMKLLYEIGVDVISPGDDYSRLQASLKPEWWWRKWVDSYSRLITPWYLGSRVVRGDELGWPHDDDGNIIYGVWNPVSYTSARRYREMSESISDMVEDSDGNIATYRSRNIFNWGKENDYTYGSKFWLTVCYLNDQIKFVETLKAEYGTGEDGITAFNEAAQRGTGEEYASWEALELFEYHIENWFEHPYLFFKFMHWADDVIWGDYYGGLMEDVGGWKLFNFGMPFRHYNAQAFVFLHSGWKTFDPPIAGLYADYWTRNHPEKRALMCPAWQGGGGIDGFGDKVNLLHLKDIEVAKMFGSTSRIGGYYLFGLDSIGKFYWNTLLSDIKYYPNHMRELKWWSDFLEEQDWILKEMLTPKPKIAVLYIDQELKFLEATDVTVRAPIFSSSYQAHYLDWEAILRGELSQYEVFFMYATRMPEDVLDKVLEFKNNGGTVIGIFAGGMFDIFGERTPHFEDLFGAVPDEFLIRHNEDGRNSDRDNTDPVNGIFRVEDNIRGDYHVGSVNSTGGWTRGQRFITVSPNEGTEVIGGIPDYNDAPIATISASLDSQGIGIYYGVRTINAQVDRNFKEELLKMAQVERPLIVRTAEGDEISSYLKTNDAYHSSIVILINTFDEPEVMLELAGMDGYGVWDVRTEGHIGTVQNGTIGYRAEKGKPVILFISKGGNETISRFLTTQVGINEGAENLFPFDGATIHFFVKVDYSGKSKSQQIRNLPVSPNTVIVVGEGVSKTGRYFANRIQAFFDSLRTGKQRVLLDILEPSEVTPEILSEKNILLIGGPGENSLSAALISQPEYGLADSIPISGRQKSTWYSGGNANMILDAEANYMEFYNQLRLFVAPFYTGSVELHPISAPWEGYTSNVSEIMDKGWLYRMNGRIGEKIEDYWTVTEEETLLVTPFEWGPKLTAHASCLDVAWYDISFSLDVKLSEADSLLGLRIGKYMFKFDSTDWYVFEEKDQDWSYPDPADPYPILLEQGLFDDSIGELETDVWYDDIKVILNKGTFSVTFGEAEIVSIAGLDNSWVERRVSYHAGAGPMELRNIQIHTRDLDSVRFDGDVNGDGRVDIKDLAIVGKAFNTVPGDANWNPRADIADPRDIIDTADLDVVAGGFGRRAQ